MSFEYKVSKLTKEKNVIKLELFEVLKKKNEHCNRKSLIILNNDLIFNLN